MSPGGSSSSTKRDPRGTVLQRALAQKGYQCQVIAPTMIPRRSGDRIKTDRRDCVRLAELARAGELRPVWVPEAEDGAIRDSARAREDAIQSRQQARQQLQGFLLRHELRYTAGKKSWTVTFQRWLATLNPGPGAAQTAFTEYWQAVCRADERVARLTQALIDAVRGWRLEPVVLALQSLRGIAQVSAIGLVAEIGDIVTGNCAALYRAAVE